MGLQDDSDEEGGGDGEGDHKILDAEAAERAALLQRYSLDYSRWDSDITSDPATQAEIADKEKAKEKAECEAFEKANPDFCNEYKEDAEKYLCRKHER